MSASYETDYKQATLTRHFHWDDATQTLSWSSVGGYVYAGSSSHEGSYGFARLRAVLFAHGKATRLDAPEQTLGRSGSLKFE
jgi:hypothetical protein